jgi:hypothetical protein
MFSCIWKQPIKIFKITWIYFFCLCLKNKNTVKLSPLMSKPGEVNNLFALDSMKSPYSCTKVKHLFTLSIFGSQFFFFFFLPIILLLLQFACVRSSYVTDIWPVWFYIQYFIKNFLNASFLRSLSNMFVLWKVGSHTVAGKDTL